MLQKEFFQVQPFNPNPYWDPAIVNLSGAQKFEEDTVFVPGRYKVFIQSAATATLISSEGPTRVCFSTTLNINDKFIALAYCGSDNTSAGPGTNPYVGPFKVNPKIGSGAPAYVSHIFGNAGSANVGGYFSAYGVGGGNCLGDGAFVDESGSRTFGSASAGCCLHLLPVNGVFGSDYLFAFHLSGGAWNGGGGSAYGGAASGGAYQGWSEGGYFFSSDGGSTPYGTGGAGRASTPSIGSLNGLSGTGIGHGKADGTPAGAWFDGSVWQDMSLQQISGGDNGKIIVTYLGPLE